MAQSTAKPKPIPEHEIKQNSGASATMALQAAQKAWELRQAANAAGDPNAREEILAKAINKEIEAESFGKAAKYTRSGAFQGLAAGAGLGVQPGVTLGKLTGALVGGVVATVTGLLGGGIGSVYGAINGPFWDLGEMASHGVRSIVGDFPNWKSTPAQKKALEKMVMQTKETQAPTREELEEMKRDAPDEMPDTWSQRTKDMTSWRPSMPSMPAMPSMPTGAALGLGGLGSSMPSWGGGKSQEQPQGAAQTNPVTQKPSPKKVSAQKFEQETRKSQEVPAPKEAPKLDSSSGKEPSQSNTKAQSSTPQRSTQNQAKTKSQTTSKPKEPRAQVSTPQPKSSPQAKLPVARSGSQQTSTNKSLTSTKSQNTVRSETQESKSSSQADQPRKKPRKLASRDQGTKSNDTAPPRRTPRKLETRKAVAA